MCTDLFRRLQQIRPTKSHKEFYQKNVIKQADGIDQDQTAQNVQSDLDLCCTQKPMVSPLAPKGLKVKRHVSECRPYRHVRTKLSWGQICCH